MIIQIIFVFLFALNLFFLWVFHKTGKTSWYGLVGSLLFLFLPLGTVFFGQPRFELDYFWWRVAGPFCLLLGLSLLILALLEFKKSRVAFLGEPDQLVTSGPYQYLRHPQYLGMIFILVGWWWAWGGAWAFYFGTFILALVWLQGYLEEKLILEKKFGKQYQDYRKIIGMFWIK
jgi:protein-S-isoprenylcysteine O-methyltransferase Ste14